MEESYHQIIYLTLARRIEELEKELAAEKAAGEYLLAGLKEVKEDEHSDN